MEINGCSITKEHLLGSMCHDLQFYITGTSSQFHNKKMFDHFLKSNSYTFYKYPIFNLSFSPLNEIQTINGINIEHRV